jgi:hypothetical protein
VCRIRSSGKRGAEIVRVSDEQRPSGPAENAFVVIERLASGKRRGRYITWIGYHDLEEAQLLEPNVWKLVEPPRPYRRSAEWTPFGWPEMQALPNHC